MSTEPSLGSGVSWKCVCHVATTLLWASFVFPGLSQTIDFGRDIRPILADNCFACHGPDSAARMADLRLDVRQHAIDMGAIIPGDPDGSVLIERIYSRDPDLLMPPADSHKSLSKEQKSLLKRWIAEGASYREHWAWIAPVSPQIPEVSNTAWVRNPIDRFVLAALEAHSLAPAPEADLNTLIRRVTLDLTGLPPDPQRLREVVSDPGEDRYERYVDWLLEQPQWGEHRARYWLDYARYADTHGLHFDNYREMWAYRDWLIDAFNRNMPFDQFTIEQLAGDLLPEPTLDQRIATGFNRCNITTNEGGVIEDEYRVLYARDRVETTMLVWNGLTMGCAVCHDHKYDPFTMRDFYQLTAFFNNTSQPVMDGNIKDTPPVIPVVRREDRAEYDNLNGLLEAVTANMANVFAAGQKRFEAEFGTNIELRKQAIEKARVAWPETVLNWPVQDSIASGNADKSAMWAPGYVEDFAWIVSSESQPAFSDSGDFERDEAFSISVWIRPKSRDGAILARMDDARGYQGWDVWLQGGLVGMHLIHRWPEDALKVVATEKPLRVDRWHHVAVTYDGSSVPGGVKIYVDGEPVATRVEQHSLKSSVRTTVPLKIGSRNASSRLDGSLLQAVRILRGVLDPGTIEKAATTQRAAYLLARPDSSWTESERSELVEWYLSQHDSAYIELREKENDYRARIRAIEARGTIAHVMQEKNEMPRAHVLARGEYNRPLEEVVPETPAALPPMADHLPRNRLGFALWLFDKRHPLTARVTVNRFWQEVFGRGIVATSEDFGTMGQLPSHPELLDFLAIWFRENNWDVKALFRLIVTSATYRQSAEVTEEKLRLDPDNQWLSRGPRFRLDAETIRDSVLFVTGLLCSEIGGASVKPYQPEGVWEAVAMPESNTRIYEMDSGNKLYRRSMYTFWKRAAPPAFMEVFNAPSREVCTIRRERTNTPLQALAAMNDIQMIEAARVLAQNMVGGIHNGQWTESTAVDELGWRILGRDWRVAERRIIEVTLRRFLEQFGEHPEGASQLVQVGKTPVDERLDAVQVAAWTMLINQLLNLDEFLCK